MVSAGRAGWVSVCVPSPPPPRPTGTPVPTSVFDLLLARLGGGHHVGGHLVDSARALLQATQVGAVLVGLHLGAWVARGCTLLRMIISRSIHVVASGMISFIL